MKYKLSKLKGKLQKDKKVNDQIKEKFKIKNKKTNDESLMFEQDYSKSKSASPRKTVDESNKIIKKFT